MRALAAQIIWHRYPTAFPLPKKRLKLCGESPSNEPHNSKSLLYEYSDSENNAEIEQSDDKTTVNSGKTCKKVCGMLNNLLETGSFGSSLSSCDSNEEFLASTENMLTEIHSKVRVLLHATEKAMSEHEREMETVVSRGTCPDNVNALFIEGDPAGRRGLDLTDQHREYLIYKGAYQPVVAKYPINTTISARKQNCVSHGTQIILSLNTALTLIKHFVSLVVYLVVKRVVPKIRGLAKELIVGTR